MARTGLPSGTVTFLFTDVEGSTRLLHELGPAGYEEALAEHRRVLRRACGAHGGIEVDTQGDAFFVAFPTAPGAIAAAAEALEALEQGPIRVRIGVHTGTAHAGPEGYVGLDVHRAARIAAAGHGGQVLVSAATAALLGPDGLRDLGEHRLKDLSAPERIFQLGDGEFPPLASLHQTNLPVPATPFLGRERELAEVLGLLAREDVRLLTLTGPGGTGKTRLALQAAAAGAERYPQGVWWVPLAALVDSELVLAAAAQALGARDGLAAHIGDKQLLVLFDNFEQVVEAAGPVGELLAACPGLDLLVTSREPLHLSGEQEYAVPPFAPEEGVGFFLARARAIDPGFADSDAVAAICLRLDQLPLALELAAARVKALSAAQILERLERRLPLLTGGARDLPARQRTLRATIEWSHDLLSPEEQRLFARLAVFSGGCTLEAAEQVVEAELDTLQSLVDKSLVRSGGGRYWMLETIREFAAEQLEQSGEAEELRRRHAEWVLALAQEAEGLLRGDEAVAWLDRLDAELGNIRAAAEWALAHDRVLVLQMTAALWMFWPQRGHTIEPVRWLETASSVDVPVEVRMAVLRALATIAQVTGDQPRLIASSEERLELARATGDLYAQGAALRMLGVAALIEGNLDLAKHRFQEALAVVRTLGDERAVSMTLADLGAIAREEGDLLQARELNEQHLAVSRRVGDAWDVAMALQGVGLMAAEQGAYDEASTYLREGLEIAGSAGYTSLIPEFLDGTVEVALGRERAEDAAVLAGASDARYAALGGNVLPHDPTLRLFARVRAAVGDEKYETLYARGHALEAEDAVRFALSCLE